MKQVILAFAAIAIGLTSCGENESAKVVTQEVQIKEPIETKVESDFDEVFNQIKTDEKWKTNIEMREYPLNSLRSVDKYIAENDTDYVKLYNKLSGQLSKMKSATTVEGPSYDMLQIWTEFQEQLLLKLRKAENATEAEPIVVEIQKSYTNYSAYFE